MENENEDFLDNVAGKVVAETPTAVFMLYDDADGSVSMQAMFRDNPPDVTAPSIWVSEFLLVNWDNIVASCARGKQMFDNEEKSENGVQEAQFKLINPRGGFVN